MNIGQYCQRQRCRHVELEQFWQAFASRGFVSDSWAFLLLFVNDKRLKRLFRLHALYVFGYCKVEVDRISASVSVSVPNVDKWTLSVDIRFRPNVIRHFRPTFGYGRKWNFHFRSSVKDESKQK